MIKKYDDNILYRWVRGKVLATLEDSKYDEINSFAPPDIKIYPNYGFEHPALEFTISKSVKTIIDIEVSHTVIEILKEKWMRHASICQNYILIVPVEIEMDVSAICAKNIMNYEVWSYHFEEKEQGTDVILNYS